ncbi:MAG: formyltransferase family protein [Rhodospirillaceae bacterium]|nr:formyltransferase family protein [Rhodospirillaceae bacterium]MDD9916015.1 formyltransferase family protein [Rhodospirillaceae bacterium]MDD9929658.1 formyltransferase family protein [Rhodospirillaceae bacterium]
MTPLAGIGLIMAPTFRSRAYVQALAHAGYAPALCLAIPADEEQPIGRRPAPFPLDGVDRPFQFEPDTTARDFAEAAGWAVESLPETDVNGAANIAALKAYDLDVLIYSGLPKVLLKPDILALRTRFLHVHGGYLPVYSGATGFYFGLLVEGKLGNTAFWMDQGIDTGAVLDRAWYPADHDPDIDRILDPVTRADLLVRVLRHRATERTFGQAENLTTSEHFYVIHPVLKHLALRFTDDGGA